MTAEIAIDSVDTGNEQRDAHLKAADYFDAEQLSDRHLRVDRRP